MKKLKLFLIGFFGAGIITAIVIGLISWLLSLIISPDMFNRIVIFGISGAVGLFGGIYLAND